MLLLVDFVQKLSEVNLFFQLSLKEISESISGFLYAYAFTLLEI